MSSYAEGAAVTLYCRRLYLKHRGYGFRLRAFRLPRMTVLTLFNNLLAVGTRTQQTAIREFSSP
jgi:hypothetical protein